MKKQLVLTDRQRELVSCVRRGLSNREIAGELGIGEDTVKAHLSRLYAKFGVPNRAALVAVTADVIQDDRSLGALRQMANDAHAASMPLMNGRSPAEPLVLALRDTLAAVDVALDLVGELPPGSTGALVVALRKRIDAAFAALDQLQMTSVAS